MGKKNKDKKMSKKDKMYFDMSLGSAVPIGKSGKQAHDLLDRYGIEPSMRNRVKPASRNLPEHFRSTDDVKDELQEAMMNDYDTRRTFEAAAMAGEKDAKKYAKKGIRAKAKDFVGAWNTMKDLKKKYVGGGGMRGPKNEAGLTYAMVKHDRDVFNKSIDERIEANKPEPAPAPVDSVENTVEPEQPSRTLEQAESLASVYKQDVVNNYLDTYKPNATGESIERLRNSISGTYARDVELDAVQPNGPSGYRKDASAFADEFKLNLKESLKPA